MFKLKMDEKVIGKHDSPFNIERISPSAFGTYLSCPLNFYYKYICKLKMPEDNLHLLFGSSVHKAIEEMYNEKKDPLLAFREMFLEKELNGKGKERFFEFCLLGEEMVKNYIEIHPLLDQLYGLKDGHSELYFRRPIVNPITGENSSVPLSGIVDRFIHSGKIIEYKTSAGKWSSDEQRFKIQSRLYSLWYFSEHGKLPLEVIYIILLKKFKKTSRDKVYQVINYVPTEEDLAQFWEELETVLDKIRAGVFDRPDRGHKPFCDCYKFEAFLGIES